MSGFDYPAAAATAERLLRRFGADVVVVLESGAPVAGSPDWRAADSGGDVRRTVAGVLLDRSRARDESIAIGPAGARMICEVPADGTDLSAASRVEFGDLAYRVLSAEVLSPAGVPVFYDFLIAR